MARLTTPRLRLRPWRESDVEPFVALNADPAVAEFLDGPIEREESEEMVARIQRHFREHGFGLWAVEVIGETEFVGFVGLSYPRFEAPFTPCVEIGWRLAAEHWHKGYAVEAAHAALAYGFQEADLDEIVSFTVPENRPSRRVMERIGMTRDPREDFLHPALPEGHPLRMHVLYRISRASWEGFVAK